jgi:glycosyltransferase involved in cell wall biosynthesis
MVRKILIVNCVFDPEPVVSAKIGSSLADYLSSSLQHEVTVITPPPSRPFGFQFETKVEPVKYKLIRLRSYIHPQSGILGRFRESISFGISAFKYIRSHAHAIDVVYMNTWPLFGQLGVAMACKMSKKPYTVHIQDVYPESITNKLSGIAGAITFKVLLPIEKYVLRNADRIIVISEKMQNFLSRSRKIDGNKFSVVINWQDDTAFRAFDTTWPEGKLIFMYLGNIGPVAGIPFVIRSFAKASLPNARLIIAGTGSSKQECIQLAQTFLGTDIEFADVPDGKVPFVQSQAHVMILPMSKNAGNTSIPSKLPAYMFSARPIIALAEKGSDIEKVIADSGSGWIGNPEDENWLIDTFQQINILEKTTLIQKGQAAKKFADAHFSKEINLEKLANSITG